jgi:ubiquinone biosynthesis protein COQ4
MKVVDRQVDETQWQEQVIESFVNMVKAQDGDFEVLGKLSMAVSDPASLQMTIDFLSQDPIAKQAFIQRYRLGNVDLQALRLLPENTLGCLYAKHMLEKNLKPLEANTTENEHQYLMAHITETHDIWHVVTGCQTSIQGELKLEAFSAAQLHTSRFWLSLIAKNILKAVVYDIEIAAEYMDIITSGWTMGKNAKPLFGIQWNQLWNTSIEEIRASLNIIV